MRCNHCGYESNRIESVYCSYCGQKLTTQFNNTTEESAHFDTSDNNSTYNAYNQGSAYQNNSYVQQDDLYQSNGYSQQSDPYQNNVYAQDNPYAPHQPAADNNGSSDSKKLASTICIAVSVVICVTIVCLTAMFVTKTNNSNDDTIIKSGSVYEEEEETDNTHSTSQHTSENKNNHKPSSKATTKKPIITKKPTTTKPTTTTTKPTEPKNDLPVDHIRESFKSSQEAYEHYYINVNVDENEPYQGTNMTYFKVTDDIGTLEDLRDTLSDYFTDDTCDRIIEDRYKEDNGELYFNNDGWGLDMCYRVKDERVYKSGNGWIYELDTEIISLGSVYDGNETLQFYFEHSGRNYVFRMDNDVLAVEF